MEKINRALKITRAFHNLSLAEAAERVGLSKSYISELENGKKNVSMEVLIKYSDGFSIPMSSLMIFAEKLDENNRSRTVRNYVAVRVLKMLEWIDTVSEEKVDNDELS